MDLLNSAQLGIDLWFAVKIMFIIGMILYLIFGLVIIRQVGHMTKTLKVGFETPIRLLAWVHFFAAVGLFVFSLLYL